MIKARFFLTIVLVCLCCCSRNETRENPKSQKPDTAILVVPGFKGSRLRDVKTKQVVWLDARWAFYHVELLKFKVTSADLSQLALPSPFAKTPAKQELLADQILENIPLLWGLTEIDVYESLLEFLHKHYAGRARIIPLFYDWRQDDFLAVKMLAEQVQALRLAGFEKIYLIAHSNGGLIASYYLRYGAQPPETAVETWEGARSVTKVVLAGVPFRGSMQIFSDMQTGSKTILNGMLLSPEVLNSFPSSYHLIPQQGVQVGKEAINLDDPQNWSKYQWGFFREPKGETAFTVEQIEFFARMMKQSRTFVNRLEAPLQVDPSRATPLLNIIGNHRQTLNGIELERMKDGYQMKRRNFAEGDHLVTVDSAILPEAFQSEMRVSVLYDGASHGRLLKGSRIWESIVEFLDRPPAN